MDAAPPMGGSDARSVALRAICIALHSIVLQRTAMHCIALHGDALHCTALSLKASDAPSND